MQHPLGKPLSFFTYTTATSHGNYKLGKDVLSTYLYIEKRSRMTNLDKDSSHALRIERKGI